MEPVFTVIDGRNCWEAGEVVIDGVRHIVTNRFVQCDPGLNRLPWNITEEQSRCPNCFAQIQPPTKSNDMNFFQQLFEIDPKLDLQFRAMAASDGSITVSLTPANLKNIRAVTITGTAEELDTGLIDAIRQPVQVAGGLTISGVEEFKQDLTKETATTGKASAPTAKTIAAKDSKKATPAKAEATPRADTEVKVEPAVSQAPNDAVSRDESQEPEQPVVEAATAPPPPPKPAPPAPPMPPRPNADAAGQNLFTAAP